MTLKQTSLDLFIPFIILGVGKQIQYLNLEQILVWKLLVPQKRR